MRCSITAGTPLIRLAGCCCISAAIAMPSVSDCRMRPARRLQLANFWQDVSVDLKKDRVYIPQSVMAAHGYSDADLFAGVEDDAFRAVMKDVVERARELFLRRIAAGTARWIGDCPWILTLFSRGGMLVLDKIERQDYRVLHNRPAIGKFERVRLLIATLARAAFSQGRMTPVEQSYAHCRDVARKQARNFYYSFLLLSKPERDAMCAIYAFMRYCDDLSDGPETADSERHAEVAARAGCGAAGELRSESMLAGISRCRSPLQNPKRILPFDDRWSELRPAAAGHADVR